MAHLPTRRSVLEAGALAPFGLGLPAVLARTPDAPAPRARACIVLFMWGGPSHLDTWDPKPDAPPEVRGEFASIPTTTPGLRISEHFPRLAQRAHRYAVVRSMTHTDPAHLSPVHHLFTGRVAAVPNSDAAPATRNDAPHLGAVLARLRPASAGVPTAVTLPWQVSHPAAPGGTAPGQHAGWLGAGYDPFVATGNPNAPGYAVAGLGAAADLTAPRAELLRALDARGADPTQFGPVRARALDLLTSGSAAAAFDLSREPDRTRDRYGRHPHGQACLLARRLVEAGTRLVCVNWPDDGQAFWDTHGNNFRTLQQQLPLFDRGISALVEDIHARGLDRDCLVVVWGEFGRTPRINRDAGRDHWARVNFALLSGGGLRTGQVIGSTDRTAGEATNDPVAYPSVLATTYHALGIDPHAMVYDVSNRPNPILPGGVGVIDRLV